MTHENPAVFFAENGYVVLPDFFREEEIAAISAEVDRVISGQAAYMPEKDVVFEPGSDPPRVRNAFRLHNHHPLFMDLARHKRMVRIVEAILGPPLRLYGCQLFAKPPRVGTVVPLHQDFPYWPFTVPEMVSCWIALDDSSRENGCVRFLPGSHKLGVLQHIPSGVTGNSLMVDDPRAAGFDEAPVEVRRGACVIHSCLTAHRSEPNLSSQSRRGLIYIYMSANVELTEAAKLRGNHSEFAQVS